MTSGTFYHHEYGGTIAFSPDSRVIAWAGDKYAILIASTHGGEVVSVDSEHDQEIRALAFSPDGKTLATGSRDSSIKLWNCDTWSVDRVLKGHSAFVQSIAYSPDSSLLASASRDFTVRLWELKADSELPELIDPKATVLDMHFLESPERLLVLLDQNSPQVANTTAGDFGSPIRQLSTDTGEVDSIAMPSKKTTALRMAVSNDGLIATVSEHELLLWRIDNAENYRRLDTGGLVPAAALDASPFAFSWNGKYLAMGCTSGDVKVWDVVRNVPIHTIRAHRDSVNSVAITAQLLATGGVDGHVKLWDVSSGEQLHGRRRRAHRSSVDCLTFSPDEKVLVSGSFDNTIKVWDVTQWTADPKTLLGHVGPVKHLVFSKNGRTLLSCGGDTKIRVWDVDSLQTKAVLDSRSAVIQLAWSKDETVLASTDGLINLWRAPRTAADD